MTLIANNAIQNAGELSKKGFNKGSSSINYIKDKFSPESMHADFNPVLPEAVRFINGGAGMLAASKILRTYCEKTDEDTEFPGKYICQQFLTSDGLNTISSNIEWIRTPFFEH